MNHPYNGHPYNGHLFIVSIRIVTDGTLKQFNSIVFHFIKNDNEWVLTLLKRDESKIPPEFPRNNIIRLEFDVQMQDIQSIFENKFRPDPMYVARYWKESEDVFDTIICSTPNLKKFTPMTFEALWFRLMDEYLRENEKKFFK